MTLERFETSPCQNENHKIKKTKTALLSDDQSEFGNVATSYERIARLSTLKSKNRGAS